LNGRQQELIKATGYFDGPDSSRPSFFERGRHRKLCFQSFRTGGIESYAGLTRTLFAGLGGRARGQTRGEAGN